MTDERLSAKAWVWVHLGVAAALMVATLPGRTHGLGLFTEPILQSTEISRQTYSLLNLVGSLLGALFCLPIGWLMDRLGARWVALGTCSALAASVCGMALTEPLGPGALGVFVTLTRGFGQSALSVISITLIGRILPTNNGFKMGVYSCLLSFGFVVAFGVLMEVIKQQPDDWRRPWFGIGVGVAVVGLLSFLLMRPQLLMLEKTSAATGRDVTLPRAVRRLTFWTFALGTAYYGAIAAGTSIFNESLLAERGFDKEAFLALTIFSIPVGLGANLLGGYLAMKYPMQRIFAIGLILFAVSLAAFSSIIQLWQAYVYTTGIAAAGGIITVCFFSIWRREYGALHLGKIQGLAQLISVVFSALGPTVFAFVHGEFGAYGPLFPWLALGAAIAAAVAMGTPTRPGDE